MFLEPFWTFCECFWGLFGHFGSVFGAEEVFIGTSCVSSSSPPLSSTPFSSFPFSPCWFLIFFHNSTKMNDGVSSFY